MSFSHKVNSDYHACIFVCIDSNIHICISQQAKHSMCDYENFQFFCGHASSRLLSYCHFARTDPYHQCFGVKVVRHTWVQNVACQGCLEAIRKRR
ncbi:hypothetical protein B2J93_1892 [Marssonina coronariae]|uniref:Uncharacterized protein n=1 Tax=Diplocarpon coronariae TaxID=2795749 RepID=A0A218Z3N2_9HELO|nr:hypothetical protein B2J93_1892 [Marssonina coronariae]